MAANIGTISATVFLTGDQLRLAGPSPEVFKRVVREAVRSGVADALQTRGALNVNRVTVAIVVTQEAQT